MTDGVALNKFSFSEFDHAHNLLSKSSAAINPEVEIYMDLNLASYLTSYGLIISLPH